MCDILLRRSSNSTDIVEHLVWRGKRRPSRSNVSALVRNGRMDLLGGSGLYNPADRTTSQTEICHHEGG